MRWVFLIFCGLYAVALALLAIGTFGLFGQPKDPVSGVFLLPLGVPWNNLLSAAGLGEVASMIVAPAINAAILFGLWKRQRRD